MPAESSPYPELRTDARRIEADIMRPARFTSKKIGPHTRLAFSREDRAARQWLVKRMQQAGLEVRVDAAANIIGRRAGQQDTGPVIMMGSHIDTVRQGGRFDGMAGVVSAMEVVRCLNREGWTTRHPIEVVSFTCEEPSAFGLSPLGSRIMAGSVTREQVQASTGPHGESLAKAIDYVGGDSQCLEEARRRPGDILGFLELHIEQGPVLEQKDIPIGVVTAIAAPCRGRTVVVGRADHAGATMMDQRADALAGASEVVLALERICASPSFTDTVGTVGAIEIYPNMVNVIPGRADMHLEVRSTRKEFIDRVQALLGHEIDRIASRRGLQISLEWLSNEVPVPIPQVMSGIVAESCQDLGVPHMHLPSRASHDAARIAEITPIGMVFVPSKDGLSHCPEEWTDFADIARGARVLGRALLKLDQME